MLQENLSFKKLLEFLIIMRLASIAYGLKDVSTGSTGYGYKIMGGAASDRLGVATAIVRDINGDGLDELITGAYGARVNGDVYAGIVYVIFGKRDLIADIDLSTTFNNTIGFRIMGLTDSAGGHSLGYSVNSAGDVNGDGFNDLLIGTESDKCVYVIFGKNTTFNDINVQTLSNSDGFTIGFSYPTQLRTLQGSINSAGDINGDGFDDIVIGSYGASPLGRYSAGLVYVIYGKATPMNVNLTNGLYGSNGFQIIGNTTYDDLGWSVGNGDVNGDGHSDLLLCAPFGRSNKGGVVYVIFGKSGGFSNIDIRTNFTSSIGFQIINDNINNTPVKHVSSIGDVNGDGVCDIIIGLLDSPLGGSQSGAAFVIYGRKTGNTDIYVESGLTSSIGFKIIGPQYYRLGFTASAAGDVNQDGIGDIIISASEGYGMAYVIFGKNGTNNNFNLNNVLTNTSGFKIYGSSHSSANLGYSVAGGGDLNGDGVSDLAVGAFQESPSSRTFAGMVYVIRKACPDSFGSFIMYKGVCHRTCPIGTYNVSGTKCQDCETGCLVCSGSGNTCSSCNSTSGYVKLYNGTCYTSCPAGTYSTSGTGCAPCDNSCLTCSGSATFCTSCNSSSGFIKLYKNTCYASCPSHTYSDSATTCADCDVSCLNCSALTTCTLCNSSAGFLVLYKNMCYDSCPKGTYSISQTECAACDTGCSTCSGSGATCTLCNSSSGFKLYDKKCYQSCPSDTNPINDEFCMSKLGYYYPSKNNYEPECPSPYQIVNYTNCELILSPSDQKKVEDLQIVLDTQGSINSFTGILGIPFSAKNPWFLMFISSTRLLLFARHMKIEYSAIVQQIFDSINHKNFLIKHNPKPEEYYRALPLKFRAYNLHPRFLINFWQPALTFFAFMVLIPLINFLKGKLKAHPRIHSILETVYTTLKWSLVTSNFIPHYYDLVLYTSFEFRSLHLDSFLQIFSLIICLFMNLVSLAISAVLTIVIISWKNRAMRIFPTGIDSILPGPLKRKWTSFQAAFASFGDLPMQQAFLVVYSGKEYFFTVVLAYLGECPVLQCSLFMLISLTALLYLIIFRPLKNKIVQLQYIVLETVFCFEIICVLILGSLDKAGRKNKNTTDALSLAILFANLVFTCAGQVFLFIKLIYDFKNQRELKKNLSKQEANPKKSIDSDKRQLVRKKPTFSKQLITMENAKQKDHDKIKDIGISHTEALSPSNTPLSLSQPRSNFANRTSRMMLLENTKILSGMSDMNTNASILESSKQISSLKSRQSLVKRNKTKKATLEGLFLQAEDVIENHKKQTKTKSAFSFEVNKEAKDAQ